MLLVPLDGSDPPRTFPIDISAYGLTVAPDGSAVLFRVQPRAGDFDIWRVALTGDNKAEPWLATNSEEHWPSFSSDGRWVAYQSTDSGREEIYVRSYTESSARYTISTEGGWFPQWSRGGDEILFRTDSILWSVAVQTSPTFASEPPRKLLELPEDVAGYEVSPDGQKFVMMQRDALELRPFDLVVIPGWVDEMKARLATAN
jgi:Tol biopolymer transport system component